MKSRLLELKRLAKSLNCTAIDDRDFSMIEVTANDGWSFNDGESVSQLTSYGENVTEWRQEAIADAIDRLKVEQPDNTPFKY
jgi:hypothetical protein